MAKLNATKFPCPHCGAKLQLRSSKLLSPLFRVCYYQCLNIHCGFTARAEFVISHVITPSNIPNTAIQLQPYQDKDQP